MLALNNKNHEFVIEEKVIILTIRGKCTKCIRGVQIYISHRI